MNIPFYAQKWELDNWKELGFKSYADAEYWERSSCGVLALKMALDGFRIANKKPITPGIPEYIAAGLKLKAYTDEKGWFHDGLVRVASHFGAEAFRESHVGTDRIKELLSQGYLVIFGLKVAFINQKTLRERLTFWKKRGGHLALALEYVDRDGQPGFVVHHTSIRPQYNWQRRFIPLKTFNDGFSRNIIAVRG
jgi:hypothetical protein